MEDPSEGQQAQSSVLEAATDAAPSFWENQTQNAASQAFIVPQGLERVSTGHTVIEPDSVFDELGRSFHNYKQGKYFLPNDGEEQDRLDFQYYGFSVLLDGRLTLAPMDTIPEEVLDAATGTGIWAMEFAREYPESHVIGTDLSTIQPRHPPPNVEFMKDDCEEEWLFPHKFDYVHLRLVFTCFDDPKKVIKHAFDNMNPGAWIEFQDGSAEISSMSDNFEGSALQRWSRGLIDGAAAMGRDIQKGKKWGEWLVEAGFVDVAETRIMFPCNPWPQDPKFKLAGKYMRQNLCDHLHGLSWRMLTGLGMSAPEINAFLPEVQRDVEDLSIQSFLHFYVVYGRKPPVK